MEFAHEIAVLTEDIWLSTLGLPAHPREDWQQEALCGATFDGIINITGDWQGTVLVQVARPMAVRIAQIMFELGDAEPGRRDLQDALGEITNMTGGNIKALMPGDCHLSLPAVVEGSDYSVTTPGTRVVSRVVFECEGQPAVVNLLAASTPIARAARPAAAAAG
ncbi:MAG: chemotaxis protein CheX [Vicinamibacterales bacterium]